MKIDIDEEASNASIIGKKLKTEAGSNYLKVKAPILFAGIRSSFTIGIAF